MKNSTHNPIAHGIRIAASASAFLVAGMLAPAISAAAEATQIGPESAFMLVATQGMDRRQDRRANRQDCRQDEGLVGKDKRDCKQDGRSGDDSGDEADQPDDAAQPAQTDQG